MATKKEQNNLLNIAIQLAKESYNKFTLPIWKVAQKSRKPMPEVLEFFSKTTLVQIGKFPYVTYINHPERRFYLRRYTSTQERVQFPIKFLRQVKGTKWENSRIQYLSIPQLKKNKR